MNVTNAWPESHDKIYTGALVVPSLFVLTTGKAPQPIS